MSAVPEHSSRRRVMLVTCAIAVAGLVALTALQSITAPAIDANAQRYAMRHLDRLIPPDSYTNSPANDAITVRDPELLGGDAPRRVFRAFRNGAPVALAIETVAPVGYSGPIELLIAIRADGRVAGIEVIAHRETRNLGDRIERGNSDWLAQFTDRRMSDPALERWAVRKDGGAFDQFTGATVTPRTVVEAVRDALIYFDQHSTELFAKEESPVAP